MSGFSKAIPIGEIGNLTVSEAAGVASLGFLVEKSVGGGQAAGILKFSNETKVDVEAVHLIDIGFSLAAAKFPSVAPFIKAAQEAVDAELAKL